MDNAVINRYARSFVDVAVLRDNSLAILEQLSSVVEQIISNEKASRYFQNPAVLNRDKVRTIEKIMSGLDVDAAVKNLAVTMIRNGRFRSLRYLPESVRIELYRRLGMVQVDLRVPRPLTDEMKKRFNRAFEKKTGRKVVLKVTEDPSILGGAVARIGSTLIDGSLKTNLSRIREKLSGDIV